MEKEAVKSDSAHRNTWVRMARVLRRSKAAALGAVIVFMVVTLAVIAPWISPNDPNKHNLAHTIQPPAWSVEGTVTFLLGTDTLGRDILSRIIYGARASLLAASAAALLAAIVGSLLGLVAGYYGGWVDAVIMRLADIQLAFPMILLALALVAALGVSFRNLILVMAVTGWMSYARIVRGSVLTIKEREFVLAGRCIGAPNGRILFRHILPNVLAPIIVMFTLEVPRLILVESGLSFLGLGVPPDIPTWGRMLAEGRSYLTVAYWIALFPGLAIMLTVLGVNLFGDGVRDALDPRLRLDDTRGSSK